MESHEEWRRKREKGAIFLALIPVASLLVCALLIHELAPDIPKIIRFNVYAASLIIGIAFAGPKLMRKVTYSEEELLMAYSSLVMMSVLFFFVMNGLYLLESGVLTTRIEDFLWYASVAMMPTTFVATFSAYEILDSKRTKRNLTFRLKRLFGRIFFGFMLWGSIVFVFKLFSFFTSDERVLLLASALVDLLLLVLVLQFGELREMLENLMKGEW